jgi:sec-independent protein translocase protein TatC
MRRTNDIATMTATPEDDGPPDDKKMPLLEHLIELRTRLIWSIVAFFAFFLIGYYLKEQLFNLLLQPLYNVFIAQGKDKPHIIFTSPTEAFFTYVKVAAFFSLFVGFPITASQIWMFVAPGLYNQEKRAFLPFLIATPVMFFLGAAMLWYVILPLALGFFAGFEVQPAEGQMAITLEAKMSEYLSLVMTLIFAFGLSFELPVLLVLLVRVGMLSTQTLAEKRRYAIVAVVAFAGIVTPPDVFSQVSLAVPLYALYEGAIMIGRLIEKKREEEQLAAEAAEKAKPKPKPRPAAAAPATAAAQAATGGGSVAVAFDETDFNQAR